MYRLYHHTNADVSGNTATNITRSLCNKKCKELYKKNTPTIHAAIFNTSVTLFPYLVYEGYDKHTPQSNTHNRYSFFPNGYTKYRVLTRTPQT